MSVISMKQLLEAGVHFGHQTRRWNPKMAKYIYAARNDIHIVDLQITVDHIEAAYKFVVEAAKTGKPVLFVGTKKQAQEAVKEEAIRCGQYYVNSRWLGGTLTNYKTIRTRIDRLIRLTQMEKLGEFEILPKKEVAKLKAQRDKLELNLGGIKEMPQMPGLMFVVDPKKEAIAVAEARALNIPIVGIVDTNCDPDDVDYVIPGNDDAIRAIKLIVSVMANAVIEANQGAEYVAALAQAQTSDETAEQKKEKKESKKVDIEAPLKEKEDKKKDVKKAEAVQPEKADVKPSKVKKEKQEDAPVVKAEAIEDKKAKTKKAEAAKEEVKAVKKEKPAEKVSAVKDDAKKEKPAKEAVAVKDDKKKEKTAEKAVAAKDEIKKEKPAKVKKLDKITKPEDLIDYIKFVLDEVKPAKKDAAKLTKMTDALQSGKFKEADFNEFKETINKIQNQEEKK